MNKISFLLLIYLGDIFLGVPRFNNSKNIREWMRMAETKSKNTYLVQTQASLL
jgi:hypothetical protein